MNEAPKKLEAVRCRIAAVGILAAFAMVVGAEAMLATRELAQTKIDPSPPGGPYPEQAVLGPHADEDRVKAGSAGCVACHAGSHDPHFKKTVKLSCCDCHGGDPTAVTKELAHVAPKNPEAWRTSANPVRSYTLLNHETPEFVRFVNPGDLRVAHQSCGTTGCHGEMVTQVKMNMMTHGAMLWGAALYNNGAVPNKRPGFGESYSFHGKPQRLVTVPTPTDAERHEQGILDFLDPLPRFAITQPGNTLRIFERGGRFKAAEPGVPEREEEPGRPRARLSERGFGTANRTDPVFIGLQKTRLFDPTLNFLGTNDHPGDYRSSGCTACHMIYANDSNPAHSGPYAAFGKHGFSHDLDPTIPKNESGHPIQHRFATSIPSSQCMVCHIHPGTTLMNSYFGMMWWDMETDGKHFYPDKERRVDERKIVESQIQDPNEIAARGLWSDKEFQDNLHLLNDKLDQTQVADFNSHGWVFKSVYKRNRKGELLDWTGAPVPLSEHALEDGSLRELLKKAVKPLYDEKNKPLRDAYGKLLTKETSADQCIPVHLDDVHQRAGMHCIDCHFMETVHGNGKLYGEVRSAIEIACIDCHGTAAQKATLKTSGPMARQGEKDLREYRTPFGKPRFEVQGEKIVQNSMVQPGVAWEVPQTRNVIDPNHPDYNERAALAKTLTRSPQGDWEWGKIPTNDTICVHSNGKMNCISCHSSWNQSCSGCHLPQKADKKLPDLHNEGDVTKNFVSYCFQTLRDDIFMLAKDGTYTGGKVNPARSSCAVHVSSYNGNREAIYQMQQTVSSEGFAGTAFSVNVPHTVSGGPPRFSKVGHPDHGRPLHQDHAYKPGHSQTKGCTDCHVSMDEDNNALMAQLLMQGTNYTNLIGRLAWVGAGEHGLAAVAVTERDEPQTVIGSTMHHTVYPDRHHHHEEHGKKLEHFYEHPGKDILDNVLHPGRGADVQGLLARGEYLYAACGHGGLRIFDIAFVEHKGFSERIITAPVSPLGQKFYVPTKNAKAVAAPSTMAVDPVRQQRPENKEAKPSMVYAYIYVADSEEGLVMVNAATLLDGNPDNNFLKKDIVFNPDGILKGANNVTIVGNYAYMTCDAGLVVVSLDDPSKPKISCVIGEPLHKPTDVQVQFRYAFVCDHDGLKVLDVTDLGKPRFVTALELEGAHRVYLARTYAYVAAGKNGLAIVDIEKPMQPKVDQIVKEGVLEDAHDVKLGIVYNSQFAYVADGCGGLKVLQLTSPEQLDNAGWSPKPKPKLIAKFEYPKGGHVLCVSKGLDRDRAVDESGNQIAVFGRVGARPFNLQEQQKMFLAPNGAVYRVTEDPRKQPPHIRKAAP